MSLISIYLSSAGLIGLMLIAAVHNRRSGWKKARTGTVPDLHRLGAIWRASHLVKTTEDTRIAVPETPAISSRVGFTAQLVNLQSALHQQGRVVAQTETALIQPHL